MSYGIFNYTYRLRGLDAESEEYKDKRKEVLFTNKSPFLSYKIDSHEGGEQDSLRERAQQRSLFKVRTIFRQLGENHPQVLLITSLLK